MSSKQSILNRIRHRLDVQPNDHIRQQIVRRRLESPEPNTIPVVDGGLLDVFEARISKYQATVDRVADLSEVPTAIAKYLNAVGDVSINGAIDEMALDFASVGLSPVLWQPRTSYGVVVTDCFAAVAETGSVAIVSNQHNAISQNLLGDHHIVVLRQSDVVKGFEGLWQKARAHGEMPRDLTLVSGPSCTGDIEMIIEYGAHGPRALHVITVLDQ